MCRLYTLGLALVLGYCVNAKHPKGCKLRKALLEECYGFEVQEGYRDSIVTKDKLRTLMQFWDSMVKPAQVTYACEWDSSKQYEILNTTQYVKRADGATVNETTFNAEAFISQLQGRTLLVLGDSLGEQLYQHLIFELAPFSIANSLHNGNGTVIRQEPGITFPRMTACVREYSIPSNAAGPARILFCKDPMPSPWLNREVDTFCTKNMIRSANVIVLAFGAHFKPPDNLLSLAEYYRILNDVNAPEFLRVSETLREWIHTNNPHATVIWRLDSHTGPVDEYNAAHGKFGSRDYRSILTSHESKFGTGHIWDQHFNRTAAWVQSFNSIKRAVARASEDYLLNHFTLSNQILKFQADRSIIRHVELNGSWPGGEEGRQRYWVRIHADSLHFCAGGLFRASHLLVQEILLHASDCHHGPVLSSSPPLSRTTSE